MYTFTHRNPEMQIDKSHTALVLADMQNEFLEEKPTGTYYELIEDALKKRNVIANLEQLLKTAQGLGTTSSIHRTGTIPQTGSGTCLPEQSGITSLRIGFCGRKDPVDLEGFTWFSSRLLRTVQEISDGRSHLQYVAAQALWV